MSDYSTKINQAGSRLIQSFHQLTNAVRIHQDNNQLIKDFISQFNSIILQISGGDDVTVQLWRGRFHIQGEKLLYRRDNFHIVNEALEYFLKRELGGLCFHPTIKNVPPENVLSLIRLLNESISHEDPYGWLEKQLELNEFSWVEIFKKPDEIPQNLDIQLKEKAQHAYSNALNIVKEVAEKTSQGIAGVRKARRLAQTIVDLVQEDNSLMLGLATIKEYDDYTYTHSVNVALLATCLGRNVGLSEVFLEHLAVCGLFHDLGKVGVEKEVLLKQGQLSKVEWEQMRKHPLIGVRIILRLQAPHSLKSRIILGPFEHHLNPDLSGYPKTHFMKKVSLMGKILRIVDVYEALTSERSYRPRAFTPDEALRRMWSESGKNFDPILLKIFVNMMGTYPVGSIIELDSGEIALVTDYPDELEKSLPVITLLEEDGNGSLRRGAVVNLANQGKNNGASGKRIVRSIHAAKLGIQPSEFLF